MFIGVFPICTAFYFAQILIFLQNFCAVFVPFLCYLVPDSVPVVPDLVPAGPDLVPTVPDSVPDFSICFNHTQ